MRDVVRPDIVSSAVVATPVLIQYLTNRRVVEENMVVRLSHGIDDSGESF
jgi:hypothetical protein